MSDKIVFHLPRAMAASNDCLPHAAMNLGAPRGVGLTPTSGGMVSRLVIEPQMDNWVLYRLDANGGFVGDTWHGSREDALWQAKREFGVDAQSLGLKRDSAEADKSGGSMSDRRPATL